MIGTADVRNDDRVCTEIKRLLDGAAVRAQYLGEALIAETPQQGHEVIERGEVERAVLDVEYDSRVPEAATDFSGSRT